MERVAGLEESTELKVMCRQSAGSHNRRLKLTEMTVVESNINARQFGVHSPRTPAVQNCCDAVGSLAASR